MAFLSMQGVTLNLGGKPLLDAADFSVETGERLCLIGRNGAGKSTLFRMLLGLEKPDSGSVSVMGEDISFLEAHKKGWRKHIQTVFQDSRGAVNPRLTVGDIIMEPLLVHEENATARTRRIEELLSLVKLPRSFKNKYPGQLSGGQLQRVCIARALAPKPDVLLLDEALTDLDAVVRTQLQDLLENLKMDLGLSLLYVSHDMASAFRLCDRVVVLDQGRIVDEFLPGQHMSAQRHQSFGSLLEAATELAAGYSLKV